MEDEEKILENITRNISSRLKVPIIVTYLCVLILYNWDIIYYLCFESGNASYKIDFIKTTYGPYYFHRIIICLSLSIVLIAVFTMINTLLNFGLKWFYKKDKQITTEIENYEKINTLIEQLASSISEIKDLNTQVENLKKINQNLTTDRLDIDVTEISRRDFNNFINFLKKQEDQEKLRFSFKELLLILKDNPNIQTDSIQSTYEEDMDRVINFLQEKNLLKYSHQIWNNDEQRYVYTFEMSKSFKDFLKMEI